MQAGPDERIHAVARQYMQDSGLPYNPPTKYAKVDPERAQRIAQAFQEMPHDPDHPLVKASYQQMAKEVEAQYRAAVNAGAKFEFWNPETEEDPYAASPRLAVEDLRNNHHMFVFPTSAGYGSDMSEEDIRNNPLLADTGERWNGKPVTYNDMFRAVHDYFGHGKEGVGFRADGEENAWRSHASMFSPLARLAMTTETRGQNSWVNYGPNGEANQKAGAEDTVFADQKAGVLPLWAHHEGAEDFMHPDDVAAMGQLYERPARADGGPIDDSDIAAYHGTPHDFERFDMSKIGSGQGEQAYGHGLYFAQNEDVAKTYRDDLSSNRQVLDDRSVADLAREGLMAREATPDQEIARFVNQYGRTARNVMAVNAPHLVDRYDELIGGDRLKSAGKMYEVRIKAHPDSIMDWNKKLSEQPNIMGALAEQHANLDPSHEKFEYLDLAHKRIAEKPDVSAGAHAHYYLKQALGNKGASDYLNGLGIKGIKYLDEGSRGVGQGTHNYVIFDDSLVNVARKYRRGGGVSYADGGAILPPGHPEREENLNKWFGKSTAIDGDGNPLVHYHATARDFSTFKPGGFNPEMSGSAIWLTPDKERQPAAHNVGGFKGNFKEGANVMPVFVRIEKPLFVDDSDPEGKEDLRQRFGSRSYAWPMTLDDRDVAAIRESGYDGIYHMKHSVDEQYDPETGRGLETIVFSPSQIKSAIGNQGTFDAGDPDITKADGGSVDDDTPYHQTPEFQNWFGDSVAHSDNVPTTYYHGTSKDKDFPSFNVGRHGVWMTSDPTEASQYAEQNDSQNYKYDSGRFISTNTTSRVIPVHLKAERPYTGPMPNEFLHENYKRTQSNFFDWLRSKGHDSWIPEEKGGRLAVALRDPTQIKSVYNRTFDPKQKRMDKDAGGPVIENAISVFPKPQRMFPDDAPAPGGQYLNAATKENITGHKAAMASIGVEPGGKPYFRASPDAVDETGTPGKGSAITKTNLFKQKAGWRWSQAPEGHENTGTIVSVEHRGKHIYALNAHFPKGVDLARYENAPSEPRLRPTTRGNVELGQQVGSISVRGKEHPVHDHVIVRQDGGRVVAPRSMAIVDKALLALSRKN